MLRTIKLYGDLGKKFGKEHKAYVSCVADAVKFLKANFRGFEKYIVERDKLIKGYEVWDGDYNVDAKEEDFRKQGSGVIKIIPRVTGSGAAARIVAGAVLIVLGAFTSVFGGAGLYAVQLGVALVVGGVIELLSKPPKQQGQDDVVDQSSYIFSGAVNVTKQGNPVAIGYGEMIVGSQVISASIRTQDIPV